MIGIAPVYLILATFHSVVMAFNLLLLLLLQEGGRINSLIAQTEPLEQLLISLSSDWSSQCFWVSLLLLRWFNLVRSQAVDYFSYVNEKQSCVQNLKQHENLKLKVIRLRTRFTNWPPFRQIGTYLHRIKQVSNLFNFQFKLSIGLFTRAQDYLQKKG